MYHLEAIPGDQSLSAYSTDKMKRVIASLLSIVLFASVYCQQKDFEGTITYTIDVKSKVQGVSDKAWRTLLLLGDSVTVQIKHGDCRRTSSAGDMYFISKDQKVYLKFKGIDTVFYLDYLSDSTPVTNVSRSNEGKMIAGLKCRSLTVQAGYTSRKYYYSPLLYMNPEYGKNNTISRFDVFVKETSSLFLACHEETAKYWYEENCSSLQPGIIDQDVFIIPDLPKKLFVPDVLYQPAKLLLEGGWPKYLQDNLNAKLAQKYVDKPSGKDPAIQTVNVAFIVNEEGRVLDVNVLNKESVHPALVREAIRVVTKSPTWEPATLLGVKTLYTCVQPISFPKEADNVNEK